MFCKDKAGNGRIDMESFEMHIRSSMHGIGSIMLEELLNADGGDYRGRTITCGKGHDFEFIEYRDKKLLTVLGNMKVKRAYYYDKECKVGVCPKDAALGVEGTSISPCVQRIMARVGAYRPFALGEEDIREMAGISVNAKEIERVSHKLGDDVEEFIKKQAITSLAESEKVISVKTIPKLYICMDGTGIPVVKAETAGRHGKGEDGQAKTREVKLGCVFTQTGVDKNGYPVRDEGSTTYVGVIETAEEFSHRIYAEAQRRGIDSAKNVCVLGDGALWIWNIAEEQFPGATQVVDLCHAREHYWNVARVYFGNDASKMNEWAERRREELDIGKVEDVIAAIKELSASAGKEKGVYEREISYFGKNKERMRYDKFRREGFFVGSGVLEAGCRSVIGQRLKQSGMHWTVKGANSIIALRCCYFSNRWEDFWEYRAAA